MDPLSDILTNLDLRGILYFAAEFNPPWGARVPAFENVVRFHLVIRGQAFVGLEGSGERIALSPGDFALIPFGAAHELADSANGKTFALDRVLEDAGYDGSGRLVFGVTDRALQSRLLCGHFTFDHRSPARLFLNALPPVILVRQQETALAAWLDSTVQMLADEEAAPKPGRDAILRRVTELLFVQAMRHHLNEAKLPSGTPRRLANPQHRAGPRRNSLRAAGRLGARNPGVSGGIIPHRICRALPHRGWRNTGGIRNRMAVGEGTKPAPGWKPHS